MWIRLLDRFFPPDIFYFLLPHWTQMWFISGTRWQYSFLCTSFLVMSRQKLNAVTVLLAIQLSCCLCPFLYVSSVQDESQFSLIHLTLTALMILHSWWYAPGLTRTFCFSSRKKHWSFFYPSPRVTERSHIFLKTLFFLESSSLSKWRKVQAWLHEEETPTRHLQQHDWCYFFPSDTFSCKPCLWTLKFYKWYVF